LHPAIIQTILTDIQRIWNIITMSFTVITTAQ